MTERTKQEKYSVENNVEDGHLRGQMVKMMVQSNVRIAYNM